jgi:hypothetical protein
LRSMCFPPQVVQTTDMLDVIFGLVEEEIVQAMRSPMRDSSL